MCLRRGLRSFINILPTRGLDVNHTRVGGPRRRPAAACCRCVLRKACNGAETNCVVTFSACFCQTKGTLEALLWAVCLELSRCSRLLE